MRDTNRRNAAMDARESADSATTEGLLPGKPNVKITHIRPVVGGSVVYEPLAPKNALAAKDAQLLIDVVVQNNGPSSINVDRVRLSYAGPVVPPSVDLEAGVQKLCTDEKVAKPLVDDRTIEADQSCRLILGPEQK